MHYDEYFTEPSLADEIIEKAKFELTEILNGEVKHHLEKYEEAKREYNELTLKIRQANYELEKLKKQKEDTEFEIDKNERYKMPRKYINSFVKDVTGFYAPGDDVWVIKETSDRSDCPMCKGKRKINSLIGGFNYEVQCPKCGGSGIIYTTKREVKEQQVSNVYLKLCFSDRVSLWSSESVYLNGNEYSTKPENIYKTKEDAEKALSEMQE